MFKVLLIVYVIGGGNSIEYTSALEFQEFHSMDDCETVRDEIKALKNDQTYKDDAVIPLYYATKCVPMTTVGSYQPPTDTSSVSASPPPEPEPVLKRREHSRWDD